MKGSFASRVSGSADMYKVSIDNVSNNIALLTTTTSLAPTIYLKCVDYNS